MSDITATKKTTGPTKVKKPNHEEPGLVIVHQASCPKLSERAKGHLDYQIGYRPDSEELSVRVLGNSSGGYFSKEWVPLAAIQSCLATVIRDNGAFTAPSLTPAFLSKSQNNAGFLAAVLLSEGLIAKAAEKQHVLELGVVSFESWHAQWLAEGKKKPLEPLAGVVSEDKKPDPDPDPDPAIKKKAKPRSKTSA